MLLRLYFAGNSPVVEKMGRAQGYGNSRRIIISLNLSLTAFECIAAHLIALSARVVNDG